jgi:hypothetical protein
MRIAGLMVLVVLGVAACSRPAPDGASQRTAESPPAADANRATPSLDACALLTSDEIARAQGAAPTSTTPSGRTEGGLPIAQCYFALPSSADSLSLIVYKKPAHAAAKLPADLWKKMFPAERPVKIGREGKPKVQPSPQKIEGVGDEAFWGGGQFGGTLHVRKGEDVFQLSVGGPGDEAKKLEALKQLAGKIAERL